MSHKKDNQGNVIKLIYLPFVVGTLILLMAIAFGTLTHKIDLAYIFMGIGSITMSASGYWQIKFRLVPGFPSLTSGCAVLYGIFFTTLFGVAGILMLIYTVSSF